MLLGLLAGVQTMPGIDGRWHELHQVRALVFLLLLVSVSVCMQSMAGNCVVLSQHGGHAACCLLCRKGQILDDMLFGRRKERKS